MAFLEKKGYLLKRTKKELVKTYFVLRECFLFWFDEKATEVKGAISTPRCVVFSSDPAFQNTTKAKLTVFIITPDGKKLELVADTLQDKEEWIGMIRESCEYVRQFFDGGNNHGFIRKYLDTPMMAPKNMEGWFKMNGKKIYCVVHQGCIVWYNEEPAPGPVDADKIRGSINLSCCGFALLDEIIDYKKKDEVKAEADKKDRENKDKDKEKDQSIVILPPLGLAYHVFTPKIQEDVDKWMDVLASNSGVRSIPQPASLASKQVDEERELRKAGWLAKRSKDGKNRWYVVQSDVLMWFDKEQSADTTKNCRGNISLGFGSYVGRDYSPDGGAGEDSGAFIVYSPVDGAFKLSAKSKGDADEWIYIINERINQNSKSLLQLTRAAKEKTGWMSKRGKRQWFSLKNNHLMWYTDEQVDGKTSLVKGSMMVEGLLVYAGKGNSIVFSSNNKTELVFNLADQLERDDWINAIKNAQLFIQQEQQRHITLTEKYFDEFMELLVRQKSMSVLMALCRCYESEQLIATITALCLSEDRHWPLLSTVLHREIANCTAEATLFRTDSIATKTTRAYFKLIGSQYLHKTLFDLVTEVINNPEGYEVDPAKATAQDDVTANCEVLRAAAQRFLDKVLASVSFIPEQMKQFFANLRDMVAKKFSDSQVKAVGAFLFLRFLCPSIFSPDGFGLVADSPSDKARRALVLIAKVLQNTANGVQFGGKEQYMSPLNSFVTDNILVLYNFFDKVSGDAPNAPPPLPPREMSRDEAKRQRDEKAKLLAIIVRNLNASFEYLQKEISKEDLKRLKCLLNEQVQTNYTDEDELFAMAELPPPPQDIPTNVDNIPLPPPPPPLARTPLPRNLGPPPSFTPLPSIPPPTSSETPDGANLPVTTASQNPPLYTPPAKPKMSLAAALSSKLAARAKSPVGPAAVPTVIPKDAVFLLHSTPAPAPTPNPPEVTPQRPKKKLSQIFSSSSSSNASNDESALSPPASPATSSAAAFLPNLLSKASRTLRKSTFHPSVPIDGLEEEDSPPPPKLTKKEKKEKKEKKLKEREAKAQLQSSGETKGESKVETPKGPTIIGDTKRKDLETRRSYGSFAELTEHDLQKQRMSLRESPVLPTANLALSPRGPPPGIRRPVVPPPPIPTGNLSAPSSAQSSPASTRVSPRESPSIALSSPRDSSTSPRTLASPPTTLPSPRGDIPDAQLSPRMPPPKPPSKLVQGIPPQPPPQVISPRSATSKPPSPHTELLTLTEEGRRSLSPPPHAPLPPKSTTPPPSLTQSAPAGGVPQAKKTPQPLARSASSPSAAIDSPNSSRRTNPPLSSPSAPSLTGVPTPRPQPTPPTTSGMRPQPPTPTHVPPQRPIPLTPIQQKAEPDSGSPAASPPVSPTAAATPRPLPQVMRTLPVRPKSAMFAPINPPTTEALTVAPSSPKAKMSPKSARRISVQTTPIILANVTPPPPRTTIIQAKKSAQ